MNAPPAPTIFYDARNIRRGMTGVGRYTYNLLAGLAALEEAPPIRAMFLPGAVEIARRDPALARVDVVAAMFGHEAHPQTDIWLRWGLSRRLPAGSVYHGPVFIVPGGRQPFGRVVTVHDLFVFTHPQFFPLKFRAWMRWAIRRACRFSDRIISVSATVAEQIVERGLAERARIRVVREAADATPMLWEHGGGEEMGVEEPAAGPLIVTVGTRDPHKNPATARRACIELARLWPAGRPPFEWWWIGGTGPLPDDSSESLRRQAEKAGFRAPGALPSAVVRRILRRAAVLVSCSHTEGFNLTLVEAMRAGCAIVASDLPIHREVAGGTAQFFPATDWAALAGILLRLLTDEEELAAWRRRSAERAGAFSWERTARETLAVYREIWRGRGGV